MGGAAAAGEAPRRASTRLPRLSDGSMSDSKAPRGRLTEPGSKMIRRLNAPRLVIALAEGLPVSRPAPAEPATIAAMAKVGF
jgi:hypothetical protein